MFGLTSTLFDLGGGVEIASPTFSRSTTLHRYIVEVVRVVPVAVPICSEVDVLALKTKRVAT